MNQEIIKEFLHYNSDTGLFRWKERDRKWFKNEQSFKAWHTKYAGKTAGSIYVNTQGKSYIITTIFYRKYTLHRLAFMYMTGEWPDQIDHINGKGIDNRWCNLRDVNNQENGMNARKRLDSTSGATGVSWRQSNRKWRSHITVNQKHIHLGYFTEINEAIAIRKQAEIDYRFHKNHGSIRPL